MIMAEEDGVDESALIAAITARDAEVSGFLSKKDKVNAMKSCLKSPPVESKSTEVKVHSILYNMLLDACVRNN